MGLRAWVIGSAIVWSGAAVAEIDSEHLFGFTEGTEIGRKGDKELELEAHGRFQKRFGHYSAVSPGVEGKFTVADHVRISPFFSFGHHQISGVPDWSNHASAGFESAGIETKVRVLDRAVNPVGVTLGFTPSVAVRDTATGEHVRSYGASFLFSADYELIRDKLLTAFNLTYDPAATHSHLTGAWAHDSALGISGAIAGRVYGDVFLGVETRYLRAYDGMGLDRLAGHALFVGPTFYAKLASTVWLAAGWNIQVAGRANDEPGQRLDLANFEKHEVAVRLGIGF
jgi:hypothetical protein